MTQPLTRQHYTDLSSAYSAVSSLSVSAATSTSIGADCKIKKEVKQKKKRVTWNLMMEYNDYDNPQWDVDRVKLEFKTGEAIMLSVSPYLFAVI